MTPKDFIGFFLRSLNTEVVTEYKFLTDRRFRFDWYMPKFRTGIEYEGIVAGKSRHTTLKGYTNDAEKYNLAALNGFKVLRYTALNYKSIVTDFDLLLKKA